MRRLIDMPRPVAAAAAVVPSWRRRIAAELRLSDAETALMCMLAPARVQGVMAEVARREALFAAAWQVGNGRRDNDCEPRLAALRSVRHDVSMGWLA